MNNDETIISVQNGISYRPGAQYPQKPHSLQADRHVAS
jgi:hypothetical protein